jgi:alpha-beta hydrolase superfamily lysophospholipase
MVGAGRDRVVSLRAQRRMVARLPRARYVEILRARHEILMEKDTFRSAFWDYFDGFMNS